MVVDFVVGGGVGGTKECKKECQSNTDDAGVLEDDMRVKRHVILSAKNTVQDSLVYRTFCR